MSNPNVRRKEKPPVEPVSLDGLVYLMMNFRSMKSLTKDVLVTGSYVYKHLLRGERVFDLDVVYDDSQELSKHIKSSENTAYNPSFPYEEGDGLSRRSNYDIIKFMGNKGKRMEIIGLFHFADSINTIGLSPISSLVLTKDGI